MSRGQPQTQRQLRVGEEVRHVVSAILARGELHEPVLLSHPVTVTEVRMSPDLKNATVYVIALGGVDNDQVLEALRRASAYLRHLVGRDVHLKFTPKLTFVSDTSFDEGGRIDSILRRPDVARDLDTASDGNEP